ncbi:MAG: B12-binding domain-containing radical SAM protein [Candidatus Hodarchaeota archaeon]
MKLVFFNTIPEIITIGLSHVITYLEKNGYPSKHVFLTRKGESYEGDNEYNRKEDTQYEKNAILEFIERDKPDLIGITLMTLNFFRARTLTKIIKERFPSIPIIWGGIHPTFHPEESIEYADYICVGEGEDATLQLVQMLEKGQVSPNIPNIWMKKNGQIIKNDVRPLIQNLDEYPYPQINLSNTYCLGKDQIKPLTPELYRRYTRYNGKIYNIIISRGCPFACSYCCNSLYRQLYKNKGKYVRYRSVDNVIDQLKYIKHELPFVRTINIQDDSFASASHDYLEEFSEKYRAEIGLAFRCRINATTIDEAKIKSLVSANAVALIMGIQANNRINKEVFNRISPFDSSLKAAQLLKKYKILPEYHLIGRNPYETEEDMVEICRMLTQLPKPFRLQIFWLGLFPHTQLRKKAIDDGIEVNELDGYTTKYGSYPERFPLLRSIQEMTPLTANRLILYFLEHRNSSWGRFLLGAYRRLCFNNLDRLKEIVIHNPRLYFLAKKVLFLRGNIRHLPNQKTTGNMTPLNREFPTSGM